jgi:tape measure domain-containing protein
MAEEVEIVLKGKFENGKLIVDTTQKIDNNIKEITKDSAKATKSVSAFEKQLKNLAKIVGVGLLVRGFKNVVKGALNAAGAMEQVDIALTTMLGSAEDAAKLQKDLVEFAKKTPFEIEGIFSSTKQLLAYGVAQEDIIDTMSTLGNIASGVGVDMNRLALVFGQVRSTGRLLGQDLNQFTQAGVPLLAELAKTLGTTEAEVIKLKESGQISFDLVNQALHNMTAEGGRFFNLMENQSKSFLGTISNMADGFFQVKVALGNALLPAGKRVLSFMIPAMDRLLASITNNSKAIDKFAQGVITGFSAIGKVLGFAVDRIFDFIRGVKTLLSLPFVKEILMAVAAFAVMTKGITALTIAFRILTTTAFGWISVVTAVVTAIGFLSKDVEDLPKTFQVMALTANKWFQELKFAVFSAVEAILDRLSLLSKLPGFGWIEDAKNKFAGMKDAIVDDVAKIEKVISDIKAPGVLQTGGVEAPATTEDSVTTQTIATIAEDPEAAAEARLKALKKENEALLGEQEAFLAGKVANESEADKLVAANRALARQQELLGEGQLAEQKKALDQQLLDDEISLDQHRAALDQLNNEAELEALQERYEQELLMFEENQALLNETKLEMQATQDEEELAQLQMKLDAQVMKQDLQNQQLLQAKVKKDEADIKQKRKKGELELKIEKALDNKHLKGAEAAAGQLVALQNSKSKELAAVGKAAAIFQITMDTARGAMSAYAALAPIPFVGPFLGIAAAAAVTAYGAEQLSTAKSNSFAVGTPNIPQDQMANVHKGEMIVPATFSEAIRSGELSLSGGTGEVANNINEPGATITNININFDGAQFLGQMDDDDIEMIGERLGQMISEELIPALPTE